MGEGDGELLTHEMREHWSEGETEVIGLGRGNRHYIRPDAPNSSDLQALSLCMVHDSRKCIQNSTPHRTTREKEAFLSFPTRLLFIVEACHPQSRCPVESRSERLVRIKRTGLSESLQQMR